MQLFNRVFASLISLAWGVLLAALLFVIWRPGGSVSLDSNKVHANIGFGLATAEQILATLIVVALIVPACLILGLEVFKTSQVSRRDNVPAAEPARGDRYEALESRLDRLERQMGPTAPAPAQAFEAPAAAESGAPGQRNLWRGFRRHDRPTSPAV